MVEGFIHKPKTPVLIHIGFAAEEEADTVGLRERQGLGDVGIILTSVEIKGHCNGLVPEVIGQT